MISGVIIVVDLHHAQERRIAFVVVLYLIHSNHNYLFTCFICIVCGCFKSSWLLIIGNQLTSMRLVIWNISIVISPSLISKLHHSTNWILDREVVDKSNKKDRQYITPDELKKLKIHYSNSKFIFFFFWKFSLFIYTDFFSLQLYNH